MRRRGKKRELYPILSTIIIILFLVFISSLVSATPAANVSSPFNYYFSSSGTLYESGSESESSSPYFWLNSGAKLIISNGTGKTVQKELGSNDKWRLIYLSSNPIDTDNGYHPQNIFRLITRSKWQNSQEITYFKINKDHLSSSPNRDAYNGLLLISRYQNGDNLFYSGIRVDGNAIIKKKINGVYYTLSSKKVFSGIYDKNTNPNLLPKNTWIGLKTQIKNINGQTNIKLYMDKNKTGNWALIAEANDNGTKYGKQIINEGYVGIRTDFMDVEFDDFSLKNI
ncbi:MAG: hypothetical protein AABW91_02215 [Nanoarchaeota archaeon]